MVLTWLLTFVLLVLLVDRFDNLKILAAIAAAAIELFIGII
jgi:hypothetical protein